MAGRQRERERERSSQRSEEHTKQRRGGGGGEQVLYFTERESMYCIPFRDRVRARVKESEQVMDLYILL